MTTILLVSDTHGDISLLTKILLENHCDINIHLGDSELPNYLLHDFLCIKGNCDYFEDLPLFKDIQIEGLKIHLEHGHMIHDTFENILKNNDYDIFCFGHFHKVMIEKINNKLVLNPGSLTRPKDADGGSYIILTLDKGKIIDINVKRIDL